jgi:hypothetical protein
MAAQPAHSNAGNTWPAPQAGQQPKNTGRADWAACAATGTYCRLTRQQHSQQQQQQQQQQQ